MFTKLFTKPPLAAIVLAELEEAKRDKLAAETARDYADSIVKYNEKRIARLTAHAAFQTPAN